MGAFSLTVAIFLFWTLVGWALICLLDSGRNLIRNALLAPTAGASVVILAIFECSHWGLPVQSCGLFVTVLCGAAAAGLLWRRRFPVPWKQLIGFAVVLAAGTVLVGYPLLLHGFNWISYGNADMANYVLGGTGFLKHPYLDSIDTRLLLEGREPGLWRWVSIILVGQRHGCELMLAWVMSLTGLSGYEVFMPLIVAFDMALICAAGALVVRGQKSRFAGLMTCGLVATSSLVTLGTTYQLIAQVAGLGLLASAACLLLAPNRGKPWRASTKRAILGGVICGAMGVSYPEIFPFLALAFAVTHALALWRREETVASLASTTSLVIAVAVLLWNKFADCVPAYLLQQAHFGMRSASTSNMLFPYYLVPSGLASFWGFLPIAQPMRHPMLDVVIAAGATLLALAVPAVIWMAWRGEPAASVALVMLVLAARLAWVMSDFGLYKIAMYLQPFLLGSLVVAWFRLQEKAPFRPPLRRVACVLPLAILAAFGLPAQFYYVSISAASQTRGAFVELPGASAQRLISHLRLASQNQHRQLVVSDSANLVLSKAETVYLAPYRQEYPSQDFFFETARPRLGWYADVTHPGYIASWMATVERWRAMQHQAQFDMHGGPSNAFFVSFGRGPKDQDNDTGYSLITEGPALTVLNRRQADNGASGPIVVLANSQQARNHLIQIDSDLGNGYYKLGGRRKQLIALFQLEPDYFYPGRSFAAAGRVILFEVLQPSRNLRLEMEYTASLQADGKNLIPPMYAIGGERYPFGALGRGSTRIFSPPLEPQTVGGRNYVAIDMGIEGRGFSQRRDGLMRWFGTPIALDTRQITGFVRDISAVDDDQYNHLAAPESVAQFPRDVDDKGLEYSGIYEDGWVGKESFLNLRQPVNGAELMVRVMVPALAQRAPELRILADGIPVASKQLSPGANEIRTILDGEAARRQIGLRFDIETPLPAPDNRPVSARLQFVGFTGNRFSTDIARPPIGIGDHWYPFEKFQGQTFRWVENNAQFAVTAPGRQSGELAIDFEPGPGMAGKPVALRLVLPNGSIRKLPAARGRETLRTPLILKGGINHLTLRCDGGGMAISSDPRKLDFRVFSLAWTPERGPE